MSPILFIASASPPSASSRKRSIARALSAALPLSKRLYASSSSALVAGGGVVGVVDGVGSTVGSTAGWVVGVVGSLQFDVLADRVRSEYDVPVRFEGTQLHTARWVQGSDPKVLERFSEEHRASLADDHTGALVFLARNAWHLERTEKDYPELSFLKIREQAPG